MSFIDLTLPMGDRQRRPDEPVEGHGQVVSWLTDEPEKRSRIRVINAQDVEPVFLANRARRLYGGDGFVRGREGLGQHVGSIPEIYLEDPEMKEILATNNDGALIRWLKRHPDCCTVDPKGI